MTFLGAQKGVELDFKMNPNRKESMTPRSALKALFKILAAIALTYCIITTIRVWLGDNAGPQPPSPLGTEWGLLCCSIAVSIARRWVPMSGKVLDIVYEAILIAVHVAAGFGIHKSGPPSQPPPEVR
jgi:hypothetical protein